MALFAFAPLRRKCQVVRFRSFSNKNRSQAGKASLIPKRQILQIKCVVRIEKCDNILIFRILAHSGRKLPSIGYSGSCLRHSPFSFQVQLQPVQRCTLKPYSEPGGKSKYRIRPAASRWASMEYRIFVLLS